MADNNFLAGMRVEQFIKTNNDQIKDTMNTALSGVTKSVSDIMRLQKISAKKLDDIDDKLKDVSKIEKTVTKIYDIQKSQFKLQESKDKDLSKSIDSLSSNNARMGKILSNLEKRKSPTGAGPISSTKDMFKRENPNEDRDELLETISGGIGSLVGYEKNRKKGKGIFGALGITGTIGALMGVGGLAGFLLTGNENLLFNVAKGARYMFKGIFSGLKASIKGIFGIGKGLKGAKGLLKGFDTIGDIAKGAKNLFNIFGKVGFKGASKTGAKSLAKVGSKGAAKAGLKKIPGVGAIMGLAFGAKRFKDGDFAGGLLEISSGIASTLPGFGTAASIAIDLYTMKRDLSNTKEELRAQSEVYRDPIGSAKTWLKGKKDKKDYEKNKAADPSYYRGIKRLRALSMSQRKSFDAWQEKTYGRELNVSNISDKMAYEGRVDAYYKHLGVGGGGFGMNDEMLAERNKMYLGYDPTGGSTGLGSYIGRYKKRSSVRAKYSGAGKDDTFRAGSAAGYRNSLKFLKSSRYKNYVKLNGAKGFRPNLSGIDPTMRSKFLAMAQDFNMATGGYLLVNSGKRSGGGTSVHNTGFAIDANAIGPNGQRYGDGYIPDELLEKYGFHRPLLKWKSLYKGPKDEPWHIEPYPGEEAYGGPRNSLAPNQPYRKGVLLAGGNAYSNEVGGGGFNLPQGNVDKLSKDKTPAAVVLSNEDIEKLAFAFGRQMRANMPKQDKTTPSVSGVTNGRQGI